MGAAALRIFCRVICDKVGSGDLWEQSKMQEAVAPPPVQIIYAACDTFFIRSSMSLGETSST